MFENYMNDTFQPLHGQRLYRVMVSAEDGRYALQNGFNSRDSAERWAKRQARNYGEDRRLYVESY